MHRIALPRSLELAVTSLAAGLLLSPAPAVAGAAPPLEQLVEQLDHENAFPSLPAFTRPVYVTGAGDGSGRLFVLEQGGAIKVFAAEPDVDTATTLHDLSGLVSTGGEQGLLGLAFDPEFADEGSEQYGRLYVYTTVFEIFCECYDTPACQSGCSQLFRLTMERSDPSSEHLDVIRPEREKLLEFGQPFVNHNGGMLVFGPDGHLYVATGDGGSGNDPQNNGQRTDTFLGKLLRIDVSPSEGYAVPADNPFVGVQGAVPEIYHYGLRNPWRFSFDRLTGDLWIGDVGQVRWEEVSFLPAGADAGANFGWKECEGIHVRGSLTTLCTFPSVLPVLAYGRSEGSNLAVTGGYVYRGPGIPALQGAYVYADYTQGKLWAWDRETTDAESGLGTPLLIDDGTVRISSFGEADDGELYFTTLVEGAVRRLVPEPSGAALGAAALLTLLGLARRRPRLAPRPTRDRGRLRTAPPG